MYYSSTSPPRSRPSTPRPLTLCSFFLCQFKHSEIRGPLETVVENTFPHLERIFGMCLQMDEDGAADLMKSICGIFWSSTQVR